MSAPWLPGSGEQVRASLGELHIGAALILHFTNPVRSAEA
jgi:hypothetical protein